MYISTKHSKCVHSSKDCSSLRSRHVIPISNADGMHKCKLCFPRDKTCMICFEPGGIPCPCASEHYLCHSCIEDHVKHLLENPEWNHEVTCPCGYGTFDKLPPKILRLMTRSVHRSMNQYARSEVDVALQDILTSRCQNCNAAFYDFDGCASVRCRCNKYFCALCLRIYDTSDECHAHVVDCELHPNCKERTYYVKYDDFERIQHNRKCRALWKFMVGVLVDSKSVVYTMGVMVQVHQHGNALMPYMRKPARLILHTLCLYMYTRLYILTCVYHVLYRFIVQ